MALPERVRVKVLSEGAAFVSTERVTQSDVPFFELLEAAVSVGGKNLERLAHIFRTGTIVVNGYRYRWAPFEVSPHELEPLLATFPDPRPDRPFEPDRCVYARIAAGVETIQLHREQAARRGFRKKGSFWEV